MSIFIEEVRIDRLYEDDSYVWELPIIKSFEKLSFTTPVTFLIGENGTGKSTLLEAIAISYGFNAEGGSLNYQFATKRTDATLSKAMRIARKGKRPKDGFFLRAESFYNLASYTDEIFDDQERQEFGGRSLHEQSHGESFLNLIKNRFRGQGLYILDEPESALSPQRQLALMVILHELAQQGSQFIIATHSPFLIGLPGALIYTTTEERLTCITYEESELYQLTNLWIQHRKGLLKDLLQNEEKED